MELDFDLARFGERIREIRVQRKMTLNSVFEVTGISIPTLSRVERGDAKEIESKTLLTLASWAKLPLALFQKNPLAPPTKKELKSISTPDAVELHLRADKNLNIKTADLLVKMFRAAYSQAASESED